MRKVLYILGQLEDLDLEWMLRVGDARPVPADFQIVREGVGQGELFIVIQGELAVSKAGRALARLGPGEVVGEMSMLDSRPASATLTTLADTLVFAIPYDLLRAKLRSDSGFASRFYRAMCIFLANRLNDMDATLGHAVPLDRGRERGEAISPDALGSAGLAAARFAWFLERVQVGSTPGPGGGKESS